MINDKHDWLVVGQFGRVHGIRGYITVHSFTDPEDNIISYPNWYRVVKNTHVPLVISDIVHHHNRILVKVEGYTVREDAASLTNSLIAVSSAVLPELDSDEFYWHELLGMSVLNKDGVTLGTLSNIMTGVNYDIFVVSGQETQLIPYLDTYVTSIDRDQRVIHVDWEPV